MRNKKKRKSVATLSGTYNRITSTAYRERSFTNYKGINNERITCGHSNSFFESDFSLKGRMRNDFRLLR